MGVRTISTTVLAAGLLLAALRTGAQFATPDTIALAPATYLCDTAAWQLVFSDDFDGAAIDPARWHTFNVWAGMQPAEHDNWSGARITGPHSIARDENVVITDGVCHLILKKELNSWRCDTCRETAVRAYSTGVLVTHYTQSVREGRIEARIQFSKAPWTHGAFWTWPGESAEPGKYRPEIDIVEAKGYEGVPIAGNNGFPHAEWSTHRWEAAGVPSLQQSRRYPRQTFAAWLRGRYFDQSAWHTYAVEWDENKIAFLLDGEVVDEVWRYECLSADGQWRPSGCIPAASVCCEHPRWPSNRDTKGSNLRLTMDTGADKARRVGEVGRMSIDYVRVWQRADRK